MAPRIEPLRARPIAFAHRGAKAHVKENTIEAFTLALRLGATGLETDVWLTADGEAVLDHDGLVRRRGRRRPIDTVDRAALPTHIPTPTELYRECGADYELSVDVKVDEAAPAMVAAAIAAEDELGVSVLDRLWLVSPHLDALVEWGVRWSTVKLVHSVRMGRIDTGPERHAAQLADRGIDALNMHYTDWTGGMTTLTHRFGLHAFGWDAQHTRVLRELLDMGIDGVYSDHVDRMVTAVDDFYPDR